MDGASAWILNLDADAELARPRGYTRSRAMQALVDALRPRALGLLAEGDVLLDAIPEGADRRAYVGRAFCPTPSALAAFARAGVPSAPAPPLDVLRRVNDRRFAMALGETLPGAVFATTLDEVAAAIAGPSPTGTWILKHAHGFAGRGRRRVSEGALDDGARAFVTAQLRDQGGLGVEPWVERRGDFALHGFVPREGAPTLGRATRQTCDAVGTWLATELADSSDLTASEGRALTSAAEQSARALADAGYFGPFGVDAFRYVGEAGRERFCARCELNARYSMGWAIGMGDLRPDRAA